MPTLKQRQIMQMMLINVTIDSKLCEQRRNTFHVPCYHQLLLGNTFQHRQEQPEKCFDKRSSVSPESVFHWILPGSEPVDPKAAMEAGTASGCCTAHCTARCATAGVKRECFEIFPLFFVRGVFMFLSMRVNRQISKLLHASRILSLQVSLTSFDWS